MQSRTLGRLTTNFSCHGCCHLKKNTIPNVGIGTMMLTSKNIFKVIDNIIIVKLTISLLLSFVHKYLTETTLG